MRVNRANERRGVILMVVLSLLTLFAIIGISFVLYADSEATSSRIAREGETQQRADVPPEEALAYFLSQFIYDVDDTNGVGSAMRGHSLARTMYGYNYTTFNNVTPYNGVGRLHTGAGTYMNTFSVDDYTLINYTWFSGDGFLRDPERFGRRALPSVAQINPYIGGNAPYTYPDLNSCFLAAVTASGQVLTPSFHRPWLFNPGKPLNDMTTNPNWTNPQGKYMTLRPRPFDHAGFPAPDDATGDVKNLIWGPGGNDSIWMDLGAPVMTAPDGTLYKMLFAPLIMDLDNRINLNAAGNVSAFAAAPTAPHVSNQGWGSWEANLGKVLYADSAATPVEWINLFRGRTMPDGNMVYGKYGASPYTPTTAGLPTPANTPIAPGVPAPFTTYPHAYAQVDANGLNENGAQPSSRPLPPGFLGNGFPTYPFPIFPTGYYNGGILPTPPATELTNHPLLYNMFRPSSAYPVAAPIYNRVFGAADMEALLRPSNNYLTGNTAPVDTASPALNSDLLRLCPINLGPGAVQLNNPPYNYPRCRNLVTTLSMDLGAPGVTPYWWNGMTTGYLAANPNQMLAPVASVPAQGTTVSFPPLTTPWNALTGTMPSEFGPDWRATSANTATYLLSTNPTGYTSPGARIRLNRPLPPYPHMGAGLTPPYTTQPPAATLSPYGVAYNLTVPGILNQYQAALNARQALANDIYRRLLAVTGLPLPATAAAPIELTELAPRRWLAQLAVNIVDFIDEDDISTPFNFYTVADGLPRGNLGLTAGPDDPAATGANPLYWVFGTELPKVVLNEVLAEATNPDPTVKVAADAVNVWLELLNTMPGKGATGVTNTQLQDGYRVPLYVTLPAGGGYSPYRISIAQTTMNTPPTGGAIELPDTSANPLGKAYVGGPFPKSTTDADFSIVMPMTPGSATPTQAPFTVPGSANVINAGVDIASAAPITLPYFLMGPPPPAAPYQDPFTTLPPNNPVQRTASLQYTPNWNVVTANDERTTGLTVMLRRLANPYLPLQVNAALPNYNPYVTVDYIQNVPIRPNTPAGKGYPSWGKTQPYAALALPGNPASPVAAQIAGPLPAATTTNNVINTFGYTNFPVPPSAHYDWLVHLDRPPISPMELLHVSAWPPYMLTQRFMLGADNSPAAATSVVAFGHYAPWFDAVPLGQTLPTMNCPWWFDGSWAPGLASSHRLYRLFEFLECGDRAFGVNGLGRIPGKVNINTIWDPEILQALIDANLSMGITPTPSQYPPNGADTVAQIFNNMIQSRSPSALYNLATGTYGGFVGPVNMGTGKDDRPFLPLSAGLTTAAPGTQYPNGTSITTDTLLRTNNPFASPSALPLGNNWLLFQNPTDTAATAHPYWQTQLLTKLYNNVTTRSNTFAVFLTVGFFQVTNPATTPPQLGPEIGRSEGRQVRHRMFAIVDRTNLASFASTSSTAVTGPIVAPLNLTGAATITLNSPLAATVVAGTQLVIEPGTANEETVVVTAVTQANPAATPPVPATITANFTLPHPNALATGNASTTYAVIQRGNPGPWTTRYDMRFDPGVVLYWNIID